ncbi:MAG: porin [Bacteroidetes bacterium]|nr:porin [Bacteroidota bacterium]
MFLVNLMLIAGTTSLYAQTTPEAPAAPKAEKEEQWYETFKIRGYLQVRYNRFLETNEKLKCDQCDKSWGDNGGIFIRRTRIIFSGQISKQVYFYIQPDFASAASSTSLNFAQLRDAYFDLGFDKKNEFRVRLGQSKVPFGFENMQSSQNRMPLDRDDAINSAFSNERDMGAFFYWAPSKKRKLLSHLVKAGLKGTGDYGVFAFGVFNGQTANKSDLNNEVHVVGRLSYPFELGNQIIEAGVQGYSGKYVMAKDQISSGVKTTLDKNYTDQRVAGSFTLYPKPFGIQAEYNIGEGPEFNKATDSIETKDLYGGYVILSYMTKVRDHIVIPFVRYQYYNGGKKHELDARSYEVEETEIGIEWQPVPQFEFVAMYTISKRKFEDAVLRDNYQEGSLLRLQAQINF